MRNPFFKALALFLAALSVTVAVFCFYGGFFLSKAGLYSNPPEALFQARSEKLAQMVVNRHAAQQYSNLPDNILAGMECGFDDSTMSNAAGVNQGSWQYTIRTANGTLAEGTESSTLTAYSFNLVGRYPVKAPDSYTATDYTFTEDGIVYLAYQDAPACQVTVYLAENAITALYGMDLSFLMALYDLRYAFLVVFFLMVAVFIGCVSFLSVTAGRRKKGDPVQPGGLNRLPLDLYAAGVVAGIILLILFCGSIFNPYRQLLFAPNQLDGALTTAWIFQACLITVAGLLAAGFLFAFAAQAKAPDRFWLRNTLLYRLLAVLLKTLRKAIRFAERYFRMLPVIWQWLATGCVMLLVSVLGLISREEGVFIFFLLVSLGIVAYGAWAYGILLKGAKEMVAGKLTTRIPTKYLFGSFRDMANQLNCLSGTVNEAAAAQMRSERMKAELITNVSHDIKTPLTSIINYTDLLRSAETEEVREEYLKIIETQGMRLKKLIEDLTQLSRASTGNLNAEIVTLDATEALNQALGEFTDKLEKAQLQVHARIPEQPVAVLADGRLLWRVLANLLTNIVKYAQAGTRVYVDLLAEADRVQIVLKNISREPLNISAQELQERFVRGDAARNTEGSGLGLSIAASLMEAQHGKLELKIDGDLFTAALDLPAQIS